MFLQPGHAQPVEPDLLIMLASALGCAAAPNAATLIAARLVQGVGGALVVPSSLAMLNGALSPVDRARGIGIWAGLSTLGATVGPYAGGWLVDHASWRYIFLLNLPLVLAAYAALRHVPEVDRSRRPLSLDVPGALLAVVGLGAVIYAMTAGPASGWGSVPVLTSGVVGVVCLATLVPVERRQQHPIIQLALFRIRQFTAINAATLLFYGALAAVSYLVVLQCELQLGYSATAAGAASIPESVVFLLVSPLVGGLVARVGIRWPMAAGLLLTAEPPAGFPSRVSASRTRRRSCPERSCVRATPGPRRADGRRPRRQLRHRVGDSPPGAVGRRARHPHRSPT